MNPQDQQFQLARDKLDTGMMLCDYARYEYELALRKSWKASVEELFDNHPAISEFSWEQYSQKAGGFYCGSQEAKVDAIGFRDADTYEVGHVLYESWLAWKDVCEMLHFYKGSELRQLFGNFVEVTVRRDELVQLDVAVSE
jgi:hypothetical protein